MVIVEPRFLDGSIITLVGGSSRPDPQGIQALGEFRGVEQFPDKSLKLPRPQVGKVSVCPFFLGVFGIRMYRTKGP